MLLTLVCRPTCCARSWSMLTPARIRPPDANRSPVSRLPVWQLWMPHPRALGLYSPRIKRSFSLNDSSGASTRPNSNWPSDSLAHQCFLTNPLPAKTQANRTGGSLDELKAVSSPYADIDSSQGRAMLAPKPRRIVRRDNLWRE